MTAVERYGREQPGFLERVAASLEQLRTAAAAHPGRIVLATSLGAEDMVLTDMVARHQLPIALGSIDTGALHAQTQVLREQAERHFGLPIETFRPRAHAVIEFVREHGNEAMYRSVELRRACCALRKLEPLARLLEGRSAWITGLRREQSPTRSAAQAVEVDEQGRAKFSPLLEWSQGDVWHYIARHEVPYNPLHDDFHPSIGCAPCTRAVTWGEPERSGRWWWEQADAKECGLHVNDASRTWTIPA